VGYQTVDKVNQYCKSSGNKKIFQENASVFEFKKQMKR
jgi:hypothetical protein